MGTAVRKLRGRSDLVTDGVRVKVESTFLPLHSQPKSGLYQFSYRVKIINERRRPVQLIDRHWSITDAMGHIVEIANERQRPIQLLDRNWIVTYAMGHIEEIQPPKMISETPLISPGSSHSYHSFCVINTSFGSMNGHYEMINMEGQRFKVEIGKFNLLTPEVIH